jgi:DNA modification methylase
MSDNTLYYGDNLDVMRRYIKDETVDLVYLDPPFNSNADYNMLFGQRGEPVAAAQIKAFGDTWHWDTVAAATFQEVVERGGEVSRVMQAFRDFLGTNDMLAYLSMMAPRLVELRRVMKPTGSIYLHCDPTASHYLKLLMDAVFGPQNFRNEIVWMRTISKSLMTRKLPTNHDVILTYQKTDTAFWNMDAMFTAYDADNLDEKTASKYKYSEADGRIYRLDNLINPNPNRPKLTYEFLGVTKVWRWKRTRMQAAYDAGLVIQTKPGGVPQFKRYLDKQRGRSFGDVWTDIPPINSQAQERMHYPTQKPLALLKRIIAGSCPKDGLIFDPFCGCGTTVDAAQETGFRWVGIDITHLAINAIKKRLHDRYEGKAAFSVVGEPVSLPDAAQLAKEDPYQFQYWALGLVDARPAEQKKGADKGIDGRLFFHDESESGKTKQIIFSVKAGHTDVTHVRDLRGVIDREKAAIGVLIIMEDSTKPMRTEAASADFYISPFGKYPRLQILTIAELLAGKGIDYPSAAQRIDKTFKRAPKAKGATGDTADLPLQ